MALMQDSPPSDKREALKWHNRRSIVQAAARLARERGISGFTVSDLAQAAGVSRRTIFNHFSGVEEAVQASFLDAVTELYGEFRRRFGDKRFPDLSAAFQHFVEVALQVDVVGTVCQAIYPFLQDGKNGAAADHCPVRPSTWPPSQPSERDGSGLELMAVRATSAAAREIVELLHERVEGATDPYVSCLLGEYLVTTITVCADHWFAATRGELTDSTRQLWRDLLQQGMNSLGKGFTV